MSIIPGKCVAHKRVAPRLILGQDSSESPHCSLEVCEQCRSVFNRGQDVLAGRNVLVHGVLYRKLAWQYCTLIYIGQY